MGRIPCMESVSSTLLCLTNTIFLLLSIALLALTVYVYETHWIEFFHKRTIILCFGGAGVLLLVSLTGCIGALTKKKRYLIPYSILLLAALVVQVTAVVLLFNFDYAMAQAESKGFDRTQFTTMEWDAVTQASQEYGAAFDQAECTITSGTTNITTTCTGTNSAWLETFVNDNCLTTVNPTVTKCEANVGNSTADQSFCLCFSAVSAKVTKYARPIAILAAAIAGFEFLLVLCSCYLVCCAVPKDDDQQVAWTPRASKGDPRVPLSANPHAPTTGDGINLV